MSHTLAFGDPFLYFGAASAPDHDVRLSGPAGTPPPSSHTDGTTPWYGPYGTPIEKWNDSTHPPANVAHPTLSYATTFGSNPVRSWMFGSDVPDGTYTVVKRKRKPRP